VSAVAAATLRCFRNSVPAEVPGIMFLSGGQSDKLATAHLDEINMQGHGPWKFSFSYGRALQAAPLKAWSGNDDNVAAGQQALIHRARCNSAACNGEYSAQMEQAG